MISLADLVARVQREISEDIENGTQPASVRSFSALHDCVDANTYGGLCDDNADVTTEMQIEMQGQVDRWLANGRPPSQINMDEIARIIREDYGIHAHVQIDEECIASICAGERNADRQYQACAGPGIVTPSYGDVNNFYVGPDEMGTTPARVTDLGATTEAAIAELIVRQVQTGSVQATETDS